MAAVAHMCHTHTDSVAAAVLLLSALSLNMELAFNKDELMREYHKNMIFVTSLTYPQMQTVTLYLNVGMIICSLYGVFFCSICDRGKRFCNALWVVRRTLLYLLREWILSHRSQGQTKQGILLVANCNLPTGCHSVLHTEPFKLQSKKKR